MKNETRLRYFIGVTIVFMLVLTAFSCTGKQAPGDTSSTTAQASNSPVPTATAENNIPPTPTPASVMSAGGGTQAANSAVVGWKQYQNDRLHFSIRYPQDWTVAEQSTGVVFTEGKAGSAKASFTVTVGNENPIPTAVDSLLKAKRDAFPNLQSLGADNFSLAGADGMTVDYTYIDKDNSQFYESIIAIAAGNNNYNLVLSALKNSYEGDLTIFNPMLRSFAVQPQPKPKT